MCRSIAASYIIVVSLFYQACVFIIKDLRGSVGLRNKHGDKMRKERQRNTKMEREKTKNRKKK